MLSGSGVGVVGGERGADRDCCAEQEWQPGKGPRQEEALRAGWTLRWSEFGGRMGGRHAGGAEISDDIQVSSSST